MLNNSSFFRTLNSSAMKSGLYAGILWIIGLVCFCRSFDSAFCNNVFVIIVILSPFLIGYLAHRFQREYLPGSQRVYSKLYFYSLMTYVYGGIILAVAVFVYFLYWDKGIFFDSYLNFLNRPDIKSLLDASFKGSGNGMSVEMLKDSVVQMSQMKVSVYALTVFYMNMVCGIFVSIPIALVCNIIKK